MTIWTEGNEAVTALQSTASSLESRLAEAEARLGDVDALGERVAAVEATPADGSNGDIAAQLADLDSRIAELAGADTGGIDADIAGKLETLESDVAALAGNVDAADQARQSTEETLAGLQGALPALEETVATIRQSLTEAGEQRSALGQTAETLSGDVQTLGGRLDAAESQLARFGGEYQRGAAMIVAIGDINRAVMRSEPFPSALDSLRSLVKDDASIGESLSRLEPVAADGPASLDELKETFGEMSSRVLLAEDGDQSLTDRVSDNLFGIINMRPAGEETDGSNTRALLSRAQAKLSGGDLDGAVAELSTLEGPAAERADPWVERARGRLSAEAALVDLRSYAQGLVAGGS